MLVFLPIILHFHNKFKPSSSLKTPMGIDDVVFNYRHFDWV